MGDAFMGAVPSAATTARTVIVRSPQGIAMTEGGGSKPPVRTLISICETPRDQAPPISRPYLPVGDDFDLDVSFTVTGLDLDHPVDDLDCGEPGRGLG